MIKNYCKKYDFKILFHKIENDSLAEFYSKFGFEIYNKKNSTINNQEFSFIKMGLKK